MKLRIFYKIMAAMVSLSQSIIAILVFQLCDQKTFLILIAPLAILGGTFLWMLKQCFLAQQNMGQPARKYPDSEDD